MLISYILITFIPLVLAYRQVVQDWKRAKDPFPKVFKLSKKQVRVLAADVSFIIALFVYIIGGAIMNDISYWFIGFSADVCFILALTTVFP